MGKKKSNSLLMTLLLLTILVSIGGVALNISLIKSTDSSIIGRLTDTGTLSLTGGGAAGLKLTDPTSAIGSGYVNASCPQDVALVQTGTYPPGGLVHDEPECWINTSAYLGGNTNGDVHQVRNNGSLVVNVSIIADRSAEDLFCGIGNTCLNSSLSQIKVSASTVVKPTSCTGTLANDQVISSQDTNLSVTLCDSLKYENTADTIEVSYNFTIPVGLTSGAKTYTVTYEAVAA